MKTKTFAFSALLAVGLAQISPLFAQSDLPGGSTTADGYVVRNNQIYQLRNGQATPLVNEVTMSIKPSGEITGFDGQTRRMSENTVLTMDGRIVPAPPGVVFPAPLPGANADGRALDARRSQPAVTGENVSGLAPGNPGMRSGTSANAAASSSQGAGNNATTVQGTEVQLERSDRTGGQTNSDAVNAGIVEPVTGLPYGNNRNLNGARGNMDASNNNNRAAGEQPSQNRVNANESNADGNSNGNGNGNANNANAANSGNVNRTEQNNAFDTRTNNSNATRTGTGPESRPNSSNATGGSSSGANRTGTSNSNGSGSSSGGTNSGSGSGSSSNSTSGGSSTSSGASGGGVSR
jgi:hypothetical protein